MNSQQLFSALRARPGIFALVLAATVVTTLIVSLLLPKTYIATVSLVLNSKDEQSLSNVNMLAPVLHVQQQAAYMQTQVDIIRSKKVVTKVVRELRLAENPEARQEFEDETGGAGSFENWLAERLLKWLNVETTQSSVIQISYKASDPQFAARAANAFAKAYIDTTLELRVVPMQRTAEWFDDQLKGLRASLEQAQAKVTAYQRDKNIVTTDEKMDVENARLAELSTQLVMAQSRASEAESRERLAKSLRSGGVSADQLPEVLASPSIQRLKGELLVVQAKLQNLSADLGSNHPLLQRQRAEYNSLRAQLQGEIARIVGGLENAARQARQHVAQLASAVAEQRERVLKLKGFRNEIGVLSRDVETAQRTYDSAMQRFVVSKVESGANRTNVSILDSAIEPTKPARPNVPLNMALSVVIGTMLALCVVFFMEQFDRRVRSYDDLASVEVPLLAQLNAWQPGTGLIAPRGDRALPAPA